MLDKKHLIYLVVFLFPILVATVNHGGSVPYLLLVLFGLFLGWSEWAFLESWEKKVLLGFSVFFILISLSFLNAQDYYDGVKKLEKYLLFPAIIPMYLLVKKYQVETGKVYLFGLCVASIVMLTVGVQALGLKSFDKYWYRAEGAYNALIFGDVAMLIVVIIACALLTICKKWWCYIGGLLFIASAFVTGLLSGARGSWLLLPIFVAWLMWLYRKELRPKHLVLLVIIFSFIGWGAYSSSSVKYRLGKMVDEYNEYSLDGADVKFSSLGTRLEFWRDSITIWRAHPVIGTGIGDFKNDVKQMIADGRSNSQKALGHAHNIYFDALAISGLVGLFALLIFVQLMPYLMFRSFWNKEKDPWIRFYALSGMATIIAFAVFGLTEGWLARNPFVRTYLMSILVFMSSIAIRIEAQKSSLCSETGRDVKQPVVE